MSSLIQILAFLLPTVSATPARPVALHLAVTGMYDDVDYEQFRRMGDRIRRMNPDLDLIQHRRLRAKVNPHGPSFELRELVFDAEPKIPSAPAVISTLVVQASLEDYANFWKELDAGRSMFEHLRGRLAPDARSSTRSRSVRHPRFWQA